MAFFDITGKVKSSRPALPQIYAYTTPEIRRHDGWTKIGYTEQDVETRIAQQTHTADVIAKLEWHGNATYEDNGKVFHDTDFHAYLRKLGVKDQPAPNGSRSIPRKRRTGSMSSVRTTGFSTVLEPPTMSCAPSRRPRSAKPWTIFSCMRGASSYGTRSLVSVRPSPPTIYASVFPRRRKMAWQSVFLS